MEKPCMDVYHHIGDLERANAWSFELLCLALLWDFFFKIRSTLLFGCSFQGYSLPSARHDGPKGTCVPRKAKSYIP